jgi:hypothetical protein
MDKHAVQRQHLLVPHEVFTATGTSDQIFWVQQWANLGGIEV